MKRDIIRKIISFSPQRYFCAVNPDLPNLLMGPDLLVGGEGNLLSFFVPTVNESTDRVLTRLALTRLILPTHTKCILVTEENTSYRAKLTELHENFHCWVESGEIDRHLMNLFTDRDLGSHIDKVPRRIRQFIFDRAGYLSLVSHGSWKRAKNRNKALDGDLAKVLLNQLQDFSDKQFLKYNVGIYAASYQSHRRASMKQQLSDSVVPGTQHTFTFDNGVPYLLEPTASLFLLSADGDPAMNKELPIDAAAYAGWSILETNNPEDVAVVFDKLDKWIRRPRNGWA